MKTKIYNMLTVLLMSALLMGCSSIRMKEYKYNHSGDLIQSQFREYIKRFKISHKNILGTDISTDGIVVKYKTIGEISTARAYITIYRNKLVGVCIPSKILPVIYIDRNSWARMSDLTREYLMFHELGHCVLRRLHCGRKYRSGAPASLMHDGLTDERIYNRYRDYYIKELFKDPVCEAKF